MRLQPYLSFNGQCQAAFRFYAACLRGRIVFQMTYGDSPMAAQVPADWHGKIVHTTLELDNQSLAGADVLPDSYQKPQGISVALHLTDPAEADRIFAALTENGAVQVPIAETFWAQRFGVVTDRFGIPWMINCEKSA